LYLLEHIHLIAKMSQTFTAPPPTCQHALLTFPIPTILLVTLNRPKSLNCINIAGHHELDAVWKWLDDEPSLRVGIVTGTGRAFCAGADLKGFPFSPLLPPFPTKSHSRTMSSGHQN